MNTNIKLRMSNLPKALGELAHSNQFLKISALVSYGLCALLIVLVSYQASKAPVVLAFTPSASLYENAEMPKPEEEITQAVKAYVDHRYKWEPKTVVQKLREAEAFILPQNRKAFEAAITGVTRFSTEKLVTQRVYPIHILVDLNKKIVFITGDRVTAIQGLKAAGNLKLELSLDTGPRTKENPWGVYITKEKEE